MLISASTYIDISGCIRSKFSNFSNLAILVLVFEKFTRAYLFQIALKIM